MEQIIQCVPNVSEGRDSKVVEKIVDVVRQTPEVKLLDYSSDADHNRSVITFVGTEKGVEQASFALCQKAAELIDMTKHSGEHPRMGATDVIPFIPIKGITMDECVELALRVGEKIGSELKIPVYMYENAAQVTGRKNLARVRRGQYEGLEKRLQDPAHKPDFGPVEFNAQSGATAVGARPPLVAFNVNLNTDKLDIANAIARNVRHAGGGLKAVKAMGVMLEDRGIVQVSMNMVNFEETPLYRAVELIRAEAKRYGVSLAGTEIIGLVPQAALLGTLEYYLGLEDFKPEQVLENRLHGDE